MGCGALLSVPPATAVWTSTLLDDAREKQGQMCKVKSKPQGDRVLPPEAVGLGFLTDPAQASGAGAKCPF